jgi:hypothetical protein
MPANWVAANEKTGHDAGRLIFMRTDAERVEQMRQQVNSKIHWGARDQEVLEWLQEKHGIEGEAADQLLAEAHRQRAAAVRLRALIRLVLSVIGIAFVVFFFSVRVFGGYIFVGPRAIIGAIGVLILGVYCVKIFFQSIWRLSSGEAPGAVD